MTLGKILVTGGSGFIGSKLVDFLFNSGYSPVIFDIAKNPSLDYNRINFVQGDLTDSESFVQLNGSFEGIIHLGAVSRVKDALSNPKRCIESNVLGTSNILEFARYTLGNPWLILGSTHEPQNNIYGLSKHIAELLSSQYSTDYKIPLLPLRFASVYGPGDNPSKLIPKLLRQASKNEDIIIDNGLKKIDLIYAEDLVKGIFKAADYLSRVRPINHPPISLCTGKEIALEEIVGVIKNETNSGSSVKFLSMVPEPINSFDSTIAEKTFGFRTETEFREGVRKILSRECSIK